MEKFRYIFILGSHPDLSAAEVWHVLTGEDYAPVMNWLDRDALDVTLERELEERTWQRLGGSERVAEVLIELDAEADEDELAAAVVPETPEKMTVGISYINGKVAEAARLGNSLKKAAREAGGKLTFILPQRGLNLNAAQVIFNHLTTSPNYELWVWRRGDGLVVGRTVYVQDIEKYETRDTARPARDAVVGMLPPKLAQIMVNLTYAARPETRVEILDPFCGMGSILQEGWLTGFKLTGTDVSERMVAASQDNLDWVGDKLLLPRELRPEVLAHNAALPFPESWRERFTAVVTEPDLGRPLRSPLPHKELNRHMRALSELYLKAMENIRECLKPAGTVVMGLPAFRTQRGADAFHTLPEAFLDQIKRLGYSEEHLLPEALGKALGGRREATLIYARPSALVGREIRRWRKT